MKCFITIENDVLSFDCEKIPIEMIHPYFVVIWLTIGNMDIFVNIEWGTGVNVACMYRKPLQQLFPMIVG